jgi:hypothetical protein
MTRASVSAQLQKNWHLIAFVSGLGGVTGARLYTDQDRATVQAAIAAVSAQNNRIDAVDMRVTRLETAITVLALKACGDTSTSSYEAFNLKCAELRTR